MTLAPWFGAAVLASLGIIISVRVVRARRSTRELAARTRARQEALRAR